MDIQKRLDNTAFNFGKLSSKIDEKMKKLTHTNKKIFEERINNNINGIEETVSSFMNFILRDKNDE